MTQADRPRPIAHVGVTVPDLDAAIAWYGDVLGFVPSSPPADIRVDDGGHFGTLVGRVFGPRCKHMRAVMLDVGEGAALELFQFVDPPYEQPDDDFAWWRGGIFHFCVIEPDVAGLAERIVAAGGRQLSPVQAMNEGEPDRFAYCQDPWGIVIEVCSRRPEQTG